MFAWLHNLIETTPGKKHLSVTAFNKRWSEGSTEFCPWNHIVVHDDSFIASLFTRKKFERRYIRQDRFAHAEGIDFGANTKIETRSGVRLSLQRCKLHSIKSHGQHLHVANSTLENIHSTSKAVALRKNKKIECAHLENTKWIGIEENPDLKDLDIATFDTLSHGYVRNNPLLSDTLMHGIEIIPITHESCVFSKDGESAYDGERIPRAKLVEHFEETLRVTTENLEAKTKTYVPRIDALKENQSPTSKNLLTNADKFAWAMTELAIMNLEGEVRSAALARYNAQNNLKALRRHLDAKNVPA